MEEDRHIGKSGLYHRIVAAKMYMDQNYDQPLDLKEVAGEASFSMYH